MDYNEIKDRIATAMHYHANWFDLLDDTTPGHYGVDDVEFDVALADIWVDIPKRTFTFKNGTLSFTARLLSSNEDDGVDLDVRKAVSGTGNFEFLEGRQIDVPDFEIQQHIDLLEDGRMHRNVNALLR